MPDCCSEYKMFMCWDCTVCTSCINEYYMVDNGLWDVATEDCFSDVMLCIGCLENRIGGLLTKSDFSDVPLNTMNLVLGSARLRSRLTSV